MLPGNAVQKVLSICRSLASLSSDAMLTVFGAQVTVLSSSLLSMR